VGSEKKRPPAFSDRPLGTLDELVAAHFPDAQSAAVVRRLWQALETAFSLDLRGLRPDDRAEAIVGELDSITAVELIVAIDVPDLTVFGDRPPGEITFRELVELFRTRA
jgi:hypothetical protein